MALTRGAVAGAIMGVHDEAKGAWMSEVTEATQSVISLSDAAATKVRDLLAREGRDDLALRVAVEPGGCSGLRYALFFDDRTLDGDVRGEVGGVRVVTDKMSAPYLTGASIDYLDTLEKSGFTIDNPNAQGACACGESFH
jgi:iron-sulfur cluster assembly accessory protein